MMKFNYKNKNNLLILALFSVLGLNATWNFTSTGKMDFAQKSQERIQFVVGKDDVEGNPEKDLVFEAKLEVDKKNKLTTIDIETLGYKDSENIKWESSKTKLESIGDPIDCDICAKNTNHFTISNITDLDDLGDRLEKEKNLKEMVIRASKNGKLFKESENPKEKDKDNNKNIAKKKDDSDPIMKACESQFKKDGTTETLSENSFITCAINELGLLSQKDDKKAKYSVTELYDKYIKVRLHAGFSNKDDSAEISRAKELANNLLEKVDKKYKSTVWADVNKLVTQNLKDETKLAARENAKELKEATKDEAKARAEGDYFALQDALDRKRELITDFQDRFMSNYEPYQDAIFSHIGESGFSNSSAIEYIRNGVGKQLDFDPRYANVPNMMDNWAMKTLMGTPYRMDYNNPVYSERLVRNGLQGSSDRLLGNQSYRGIGGGGQLRLNGSPNLSSSFNGGSNIWTPSNLGGRNFGPGNNGLNNFGPNNNGPWNIRSNNNFPYSTGSFAGSGSFLGPQNGPQPRFGNPMLGNPNFGSGNNYQYIQGPPSNNNIFMNSGGGTGLRSRY